MHLGFGPAKKTTLGDLDKAANFGLSVSQTKEVLEAFKDYTKPHDHQITTNGVALVSGIAMIGVGLFFSYQLAMGDKSKTCDGVKQGITLALACISAAGGFIGASAIKP
jgi:hypothetical protein